MAKQKFFCLFFVATLVFHSFGWAQGADDLTFDDPSVTSDFSRLDEPSEEGTPVEAYIPVPTPTPAPVPTEPPEPIAPVQSNFSEMRTAPSVPSGADAPSTTIAASPAYVVYPDIVNHWAQNVLLYCYDRGITSVPKGSLFHPDMLITRQEFATLLNKWVTANSKTLVDLGFTYPKLPVKFDDVSTANPYHDDIITVASYGLISGFDRAGGTSFAPRDNLTREQVSAIWCNLFKLLPDATINESYIGALDVSSILERFSDKLAISSWAQPSVALMKDQKYMAGYPDRTFRPKGYITRAEAYAIATNIERALFASVNAAQPTATPEVTASPAVPEAPPLALIRIQSRGMQSSHFDLQFVVSADSIADDTYVLYGYTTKKEFVPNDTSFSGSAPLNAKKVRLKDLELVTKYDNQSVYGVTINATSPNYYYVYAMLTNGVTTSKIQACEAELTAGKIKRGTTHNRSSDPTPAPATATPN